MINIVLVNPEIPQNTGNIARTCAATGAKLHLIKPLGFKMEDKYLKRAGLDYWWLTNIEVHENLTEFFKKYPTGRHFYLTTKAKKNYTDVAFKDGDFLFFGPESRGLSEEILKKAYENCIRIPMRKEARSLNLSNSVNIVLYEALRQDNFKGLLQEGELTGRQDYTGDWLDYV